MIKSLIKKNIYKITAPNYKNVSDELSELLWANIYHDTAKGKNWIKDLSISPCGMAINYSMLYLLTRVLSEYKINRILEFGLGQSSKFINTYLENENKSLIHLIIEHDKEWTNFFKKNISVNSKITNLNLTNDAANIQFYENLLANIDYNYDLYLIDGPRGLPRFSRYDICTIADKFKQDDQFIIIMDDYQREGEQETITKLKMILQSKKIVFFDKVYKGSKTQIMIVSEKYKFATSF